MKSFIHIFYFLLLLFLPSHLWCQDRDVWVYLPYVNDYESEDYTLHLKVYLDGHEFRDAKPLSRQTEWYHFSYPSEGREAHYFQLSYDGKTLEDHLPAGKDDVFIGFRDFDLFPLSGEIWTQRDILQSLSSRSTSIQGNFDIPLNQDFQLPSEVFLHQPFNYLPSQPENWGIAAEIQPEDDWRSAHFEFKIDVPNTTLVFLAMNRRYHPLVVRPHEQLEIPLQVKILTGIEDQLKETSSLRKKKELRMLLNQKTKAIFSMGVDEEDPYSSIGIAQKFFNERYPSGLSPSQFIKLVNTLQATPTSSSPLLGLSPAMRIDTLMAWAHALTPLFEERNESPDEILRMINQLGKESWKESFQEAFEEKQGMEQSRLRGKKSEWEERFILLVMLSLSLFAIAVAGRIIKPKSLLGKHLNKFEAAFHLSFWILITYTLAVGGMYGFWVVSNPLDMLFIWSTAALFYLNAFYIVPRFLIKKKWKLYGWSIGGLMLAFVLSIILLEIIPINNFNWIKVHGDWHILEQRNKLIEEHLPPIFIVSLFVAPIYGLLRNVLLKRVPQLQQQKGHLKAELKALKSQVSPHFFFNSLNTVYSYALGEDSPKTAEAITKLSDMMRFVIYHGDKSKVELSRELEYLQDYIELQKLRLNPDKHDIRIRIEGDPGQLQIAPLILITPIENAFKHGISMSQDSFIYIDLLIQQQGLILSIENSVHEGQLIPVSGKTLEEEEGGLGIKNTRQRLELLYPGLYEWYTEESSDRYFTQLSLDLI